MINYFKHNDGRVFANPIDNVGMVEIDRPIWDEKPLPHHKNISDVALTPLGGYYTFYNQDGTPNLVKIEAEELTKNNSVYEKELAELDKASIRDIREWIASQPSAPQGLKDRESQAILARSKLK